MDTRNLVDLDPATLAAIAKLVADAAKATRDDLAPGTYPVDAVVTLCLDGEVKVSADTEKAPTCSIPLLPALALLAKRMGCQRDNALTILREVMIEAISLGKDATTELLQETGVADIEAQIKEEVIAKLPKTPVKGSVKVKGTAAIPA
jgi:hypothetical protein